MKTQEEIEQLASKRFTIKQFIGEDDYNRNETVAARCGYVKGYTQCQEDMVDVIKKAIEYGYQLRCNHKPINSGIDWVKEFNSLNKQD